MESVYAFVIGILFLDFFLFLAGEIRIGTFLFVLLAQIFLLPSFRILFPRFARWEERRFQEEIRKMKEASK